MTNFKTFLDDNYDLAGENYYLSKNPNDFLYYLKADIKSKFEELTKKSYKFKSWDEVVKEKFFSYEVRREISKKYRGLYWSSATNCTSHLPTCWNTWFNVSHESFTYLSTQGEDGEYYNCSGEITVKPVLCGNDIDELYRQLHSIEAEEIGKGYCTFDRATFQLTSKHPWFEVVTPIGYEFNSIRVILKGYGVIRTKDFPSNLIVSEKVVAAMKEALWASGEVELHGGGYDDTEQNYELEDYI
jgi:hypothetical protein